MMKIFTRKFWTVLISSSTIGIGIALACADGWGPWSGSSYFTPEAFTDSASRPFFYSDMFYYDIGHDEQHNERFNQANIDDWAGFISGNVDPRELERLLTASESSTVDSASAYLDGKLRVLPVSLRSFRLFQNKGDHKAKDFISYLALAKKSEAFAVTNREDRWNEDARKPVTTGFNAGKLGGELLQGFNKAKDAFLKERYWFQLIRFYFFHGSAQQVIDLFDRNKGLFPVNKLYYRTLAYTAGAYYKLKNFSKANYYYSKVYDGCPDLKTVAHYSFHPQEEKDWKATLALCRNKDEQATLWQMLGVFYADEKRSIREIYTLNPKSDKLNLLLTRAINKEELNIDEHTGSKGVRFVKDTLDKKLLALVVMVAEAGNTDKPYLWQIAAGYLYMLSGDFSKANTWYARAEKALPGEMLAQSQLRLLKLVNKIAAVPAIDPKLENEILADIKWLHTFDASKTPAFRYTDAFAWVKYQLANKYQAQKEWVKAVCFSNRAVFYANNNNVEAMQRFLDKPGKTAYEQLCVQLYVIKKGQLFEYQAIRLAFEDRPADAIVKMEKAGIVEGSELPGNPFNGRIMDCHDCDHEAAQKAKYTEVSLLRKMKDMQDKIAAGEDVYNNAVLLANAHYNITHYGNARYFYESEVLGSYHSSPFSIDSVFRGFLTDMKMADKYYRIALQAAQTDEQKAKCQYMLAKCERNQWYNEQFYKDREGAYDRDTDIDFIAWNGFKSLKQYAHTQYYKEVIKECGYFRTYIEKK
jgi:hypothetical protein